MPRDRAAAHINTRWFNAILHERGISQRELSRRLGLDSSAISLTFRGMRKMTSHEAAAISALLGVPLQDVLENAGVKLSAGTRVAPLVGSIDNEGEAHIDWDAKRERVSIPAELPPDTVALIYKTQGTGALQLLDGWTFFIAPPAPPSAEILGRFCLVGLKDGLSLLRFVRRGYKPGTYNLASGLAISIENATLDWAAPVLLIRP
jgi:transcriptional regulator with XRE-family HTH domain